MRSPLLIAAAILFGISCYFYVGAQAMRARLLTLDRQQASQFKSGDEVRVVGVIDGDELSVQKRNGQRTVVRLLGVKTFSKSGNDIQYGRYAKLSSEYLAAHAVGKWAKVTVGKTAMDKRGRLLAFLDLTRGASDTGVAITDLGQALIMRGFAVVFTKYPFAREQAYLQSETKAIKEKQGLWANEIMTGRVNAFRVMWDEFRQEQESK